MDIKGSKTEKNLLRTFAGESRARNMYTFFAEKAREQCLQYVASVFEMTGENEKAHAREVYRRYLKLVDSTSENLQKAAMGEAAESSRIYKKFEEEARLEGFNEIADFYKELSEVEEHHMERFAALKERLDNGEIFKGNKDTVWQCMNCGYIHVGSEAPRICPLCKYPQGYFKIYCHDYEEEKR